MFEELKKKLINSQSEWTNFKVASIIIDVNGKKYYGINVEFAVPANGICAERNAISSAYTKGMKKGELKEVHILGGKGINPDRNLHVYPCGICRQTIYEASNGKSEIFLYNFKEEVKKITIDKLLPFAFSGDEI